MNFGNLAIQAGIAGKLVAHKNDGDFINDERTRIIKVIVHYLHLFIHRVLPLIDT
jgi:hypothetical protein